MNPRFQNSLRRVPQNVPPVWFMRQAGRYHSHYQGLRRRHSFEELCRRPELACEVALGPVQDFDFDVAILFSDILFPLDAMGLGLSYSDKGPALEKRLLTLQDVRALIPVDEALPKLSFQSSAVKLTRSALAADRSLIGFVGGLWTLFVYAVEGGHAGSLIESKKRIALFPEFLKAAYPLIRKNIGQQLEAGAEVVMIFDTAAGEVSPGFFKAHLAPLLRELAETYPEKLGYYSKSTQASFFDESFLRAPWAGRGVDHRWALPEVLKTATAGFIQGNFDQALLHQDAATFERELDAWLAPLRELTPEQRRGWVCGLGHGVLPATPEANVRRFVERVREAFA